MRFIRPSKPSVASRTSNPKGSRRLTKTERFADLSSTTKTFRLEPTKPMMLRSSTLVTLTGEKLLANSNLARKGFLYLRYS
jgi:hypothetical protein